MAEETTTASQGRARSRGRRLWRLALLAAAAAALGLAVKYLELGGRLQALLKSIIVWIEGLGTLGPIVFIAVYILACVLFVPGFILTLGAGVVFGVVLGSIYVSVASTLGATCAFLTGRYLARGWVARKIEAYPRFRAVDEAVAEDGWKVVGLTRLSPLFPFNFLNYAYGLTRVSLRDYVLASWIGMIPGTVMYVYIGSLAGDVATLGAQERTRTPLEWGLFIVGLVATVVVTVHVTRLARRALARRIRGTEG